MRYSVVLSGALAALVSAHEYPNCEHDNCYRNIIDARFVEQAKPLCTAFLGTTVTDPKEIPSQWENCKKVQEVSSACSCITYESTTSAPTTVPTTSATTTTTAPPTTTTDHEDEDEDEDCDSTTSPTATSTSTVNTDKESSTSKTRKLTTKTTSVTKTYTVTSCKEEVTDCPGKDHVTTTVEIVTTICPEDEDDQPTKPPTQKPTTKPSGSDKPPKPTGTGGYFPTTQFTTKPTGKPTGTGSYVPTTKPPTVTAAAGRVEVGLAAAVLGALALL